MSRVVALYPVDYLGVAQSTRRLFPRSIPVRTSDLMLRSDRLALVTAIGEANPELLVLSGFLDGFEEVARRCRAMRPSLRIQVLWHGTPLQLADDEERRQYETMLGLAREGVVSRIGTFKRGEAQPLVDRGLLASDVFNPPPAGTPRADRSASLDSGVRVGLFLSGTSWRKNPYAMISACARARLDRVSLHGVFDGSASSFARSLGLRVGEVREGPWPHDQLIERARAMDLNLYVGLSECSPLFPLESLHAGVPCLVGPNSHLFTGSPLVVPDDSARRVRDAASLLESRLVVARPDEPKAIARAMERAIEDHLAIAEAYQIWYEPYRLAAEAAIDSFVLGRSEGEGPT